MEQQIFKTNVFMAVILPAIIFIVFSVIYFTVGDMPAWVLVLYIIPVLMVVYGLRTQLIIEDDVLRYQQVFSGEEVDLNQVFQIVTREVETIVETNSESFRNNNQGFTIGSGANNVNQERRTEKLVYVLDETGRTFFSFSASLIGRKDRARFKEAVTSINPNIDVY